LGRERLLRPGKASTWADHLLPIPSANPCPTISEALIRQTGRGTLRTTANQASHGERYICLTSMASIQAVSLAVLVSTLQVEAIEAGEPRRLISLAAFASR